MRARVIAVLTAAVAVVAGLLAVAPPAQAALARCDAVVTVRVSSTISAQLPGHSGSTTNCTLVDQSPGPYTQSTAAVSALQRALNNCYNAGLTVDGKFGDGTFRALKSAQTASGTAADGIYGPATRAAIKWPTTADLNPCRRV